jgi:tryptophan-associated transmembrane protein
MADPRARRRTFVPVAGAGIAGAALAAVASGRELMSVQAREEGRAVSSALTLHVDGGQLPLATTLAMVVLAAWGALLVTRRWARFVVAVVGALAALGVLATVVAGWWLVPRSLRRAVADLGAPDVDVPVQGWYWLALAGALAAAAAGVAAILLVRDWPEIGTRYDTPSGGPAPPPAQAEDASDLELWKAFDQGRDPTA